MRKEIYKIKNPKHIVFGDPLYFEDFKGAELKRLTVDYKPPKSFDAAFVVFAAFAERFQRLVEHGDQEFLDLHVAQAAAAVMRLQLVQRRVVGQIFRGRFLQRILLRTKRKPCPRNQAPGS